MLSSVPKAKKKIKVVDNLQNLLITCLPFIGFCIFQLIPIGVSLYMSFTELHTTMISDALWIGFDNYVWVFTKERMLWAYVHTFYYCIKVPIALAVGLLNAYLLQKITHGKGLFNTIFFIPYICSVVASTMMFRMLYEEHYGILNSLLGSLGYAPVKWLTSAEMFMPSAILMGVWTSMGFCTLLYNAAMANVDKTYYEAASIDGASEITVFFRITFPAITPTTFYLLTMQLISSLQVMNETVILAGNSVGPGEMANTVVLYLYDMAFTARISQGFGLASASAWVLTIVILLITRINFWLSKKWVNYDF